MRSLIIYCFTFCTLSQQDSTTVNHEISADERAANVSPSYAEGGLEFYEKILQRNTALRQLMGKEGEDLYTVFGNDQVREATVVYSH